MKAHPAADMMPWTTPDEFNELVEDIRVNGQLMPIMLLGDAILDGRTRARACEMLGIDPWCEQWNGKSNGGDPYKYVVSINVRRRHLNESQRAMLGDKLRRHYEEAAAARRRATQANDSASAVSANLREQGSEYVGKAAEQAAAVVKVGTRSVEHARTVTEKGTPDLIAAVEQGKVAVSRAAEIAKLPVEKQSEAIAEAAAPSSKKPRDGKPKRGDWRAELQRKAEDRKRQRAEKRSPLDSAWRAYERLGDDDRRVFLERLAERGDIKRK